MYVVGDRSQLAVDGQMVGILIINQARVCAQRGGPAARTCRYLLSVVLSRHLDRLAHSRERERESH